MSVEIESIKSLWVTQLDLQQALSYLDLEHRFGTGYLSKLKPAANVLVVGSGSKLSLVNYITNTRPDINCFFIDPSLAIGTSQLCDFANNTPENGYSLLVGRKDTSYTYYKKRNGQGINFSLPPAEAARVHKNRINHARRYGTGFAALAPDLPLPDNSIDLIIDYYGPIHILDQRNKIDYLTNIAFALAPGGQARIFPIHNITEERAVGCEYANDLALKIIATALEPFANTTYYVEEKYVQTSLKYALTIQKNYV